MPRSLLIIGSGAIGMEFASFYQELGTAVTVVEYADRILPSEDKEISTFAQKAFEKRGISFRLNATVSGVSHSDKGAKCIIVPNRDDEKPIETIVDRVILAVGIVGNTENLGLENTDITVENSHIITNEYSETAEPGVYAIGDVTGGPWLAHKASHEGIICVENILGMKPKPLDINKIPGCTYCDPQIASIGLTEHEAKQKGHKLRVGRFPFFGNGKAIALGEEEGLVKTVFDSESGELLGAHLIGSEVTELIQGFAIAKSLESTELELMETIFPHPTLSEMMHESVLDAHNRAVHI